MAFEQKIRIKEVSIRPGVGSAGHVAQIAAISSERPDLQVNDRIRAKIERDVLVALSGSVAQRLFNARTVRAWHGEDDRAIAQTFLSWIAPDIEELVAYLQLLEIRARLILQHDLTWCAVEALASELLKNEVMSGRDARRTIHEAKRRALDD